MGVPYSHIPIANYFTDLDGTMTKYTYAYHPIKDNWLSDCHKQPVMENTDLIFINPDTEKGWACCRRCGHYSDFSNENFQW